MSDLQRSFAKAKLNGLPFEPPLPAHHLQEEVEEEEGEQEDEIDDLKPLPESTQDDDSSSASSASSASSTGTIRPSPSKHLFARPKGFVTSSTYCIAHVCMEYMIPSSLSCPDHCVRKRYLRDFIRPYYEKE